MWVLVGPFDGELGIVDFKKPKSLKPNTTYSLGRKNQPLLVNNKKISQHECDFVVGPHTVDDAGDPSVKPSLTFIIRSARHVTSVWKDGDEKYTALVDEPHLLQDGDNLQLLNGVIVKVQWQPICAFYPPGRGNLSISVEECASLGIKLVPTMCDNLTHHLANHYEASLRMASSVLSLCKIVKPEWLVEVLRLGRLPRSNDNSEGTSLEDHFILPAETKYRPTFPASLLPEYKKFKIWEPNEDRIKILSPFRFVCLQEKATDLDGDLKEAIRHGDGSYEAFDIHAGVSKFHSVLMRAQAKEGKTTVVVGDTDSMPTAVGNEQWKEYVDKAKSFSLEIFSPSKIVQAVLEANVDSLRPNLTASVEKRTEDASPVSPPPRVVPSTLSEEPSLQPETPVTEPVQPTRRKLVRRTASRAPSAEPSLAAASKAPEVSTKIAPPSTNTENADLQPRPRRVLTRRLATIDPATIGLGEPSVMMEKIPELPSRRTPEPTVQNLAAPTPARAKLKRRLGGDKPPAPLPHETQTLSGMGETPQEPALKKFKALFEASNPVESEPYDFTASVPNGSQTQSQSQDEVIRRGRALGSVGASTMSILREEEEETPTLHQNGSKRKSPAEDEDAMDIDGAAGPLTKKRAVENLNAITRTNDAPKVGGNETADAQGAPVGKPDTDAAFLKAIASTKRGKKTEDHFDREFNKLKISKPDLDRRDPEEEWKVLADFGDDSGLRGNFMVVIEMDIYKKDDSARNSRSTNPEWTGKPDFKKFKKKITGTPRPKVELFVSEANDYGIGTSYWKGGSSQRHLQRHNSFGTQMEPTTQKSRETIDLEHAFDDDDDTDEPPPPVRTKRKPPSRAASAVPTKKSTAKGKAPARKNALFLDSDDDIQEVTYEPDDFDEPRDDEQTLPSSAEITRKPVARKPTRATSVTRKPAPIILDDSDDGVVFNGFKGKGR